MRLVVLLLSGWIVSAVGDDSRSGLGESELKAVAAGRCLVLERRPGEVGEGDARFVSTARLITGSRETIWEVLTDKEHAADFTEGVLESRVLERNGNRLLVEQNTRVGGPKGAYRYRLLYHLTPKHKVHFTYEGGELEDVIGSWWIFDGPTPEACLVIYSLHIDAGRFAPQAIVKAGLKKTMPKTMAEIATETTRRSAGR